MLKAHATRSTPRAFTLVETLSVVIILGIAAAVIIPQLGSREDLRVAAAARMVMADLIYAQNRAIATQRMQYVSFEVPQKRYRLLSALAPSEAVVRHPVNQTEFIGLFESGSSALRDVKLVSASFNGRPLLAFDDLGTPHYQQDEQFLPMTSGTIVLQSGSAVMTIIIEPFTGEIRVE
jgi:prepilin-type N-terminal cleavage/methylation domain-containing protein